jgi:aminopeptidase N
MIDHFSEKIGIPYPFSRYSQVFVSDFIFGGMENTTATTLTGEALLDARAALDYDIDSLVAHELAHQWWGDLITCREWPEAWLNEGFATYFEYVWKEHAQGRDEADVDLLADLDAYLDEAGTYQRPIVCRQYEEPIDLFDRHLYEKGGRVLHMLRQSLGDNVFWQALQAYAERHARGSVETRDLARILEEVSGRNLDRFFHQWVETPGHPELDATWSWDPDKQEGVLRVEQKQNGERLYDLDLPIGFEVDGQERNDTVQLNRKSHAFLFKLPSAPTQVILDPGDTLLKTCTFEKARPLWQRQLASARLGIDRLLAARALGNKPEAESVIALRTALDSDSFWAVRAAAATALGRTRRQDALDALLSASTQHHPRVRRAVIAALGEFRVDFHPGNQRAATRVAEVLAKGDPSYFVEATAAYSLGRTRSEQAVPALTAALARPAHQDVIRARTLDGLGASAHPEAFALVEQALAPTFSFQARRAAVAALARLGEGTPNARRAREHLEAALLDKDFRVRMDAALALLALGDTRALPAIDQATASELDGRTKRRMRQSAQSLREKGTAGEALRNLSDELEKLRSETIQLRERLEKLETTRTPTTPPPSDKGGGKLPSKRPRPGAHRSPRGSVPSKRVRK